MPCENFGNKFVDIKYDATKFRQACTAASAPSLIPKSVVLSHFMRNRITAAHNSANEQWLRMRVERVP